MVSYQEIDGGHISFLVGEDMSYLRNVLHLVNKYNALDEYEFDDANGNPEEPDEIEKEEEKDLDDAISKYDNGESWSLVG